MTLTREEFFLLHVFIEVTINVLIGINEEFLHEFFA